jgi:hypothetical protein
VLLRDANGPDNSPLRSGIANKTVTGLDGWRIVRRRRRAAIPMGRRRGCKTANATVALPYNGETYWLPHRLRA